MGTTDGNGIYFYDTTDALVPFQALLNIGQTSVTNAVSANKGKLPSYTSTTRPGSPASGLVIWETDTLAYSVYTGSRWLTYDTTWQTYVPSVYVNTTTLSTVGNGPINGRYFRTGRMARYRGGFQVGSTTNFNAAGNVAFSLPFPGAAHSANGWVGTLDMPQGIFRCVIGSQTLDGVCPTIGEATVTKFSCLTQIIGPAGGGAGGVNNVNQAIATSFGLNGVGAFINWDLTYQLA